MCNGEYIMQCLASVGFVQVDGRDVQHEGKPWYDVIVPAYFRLSGLPFTWPGRLLLDLLVGAAELCSLIPSGIIKVIRITIYPTTQANLTH